MTSKELWNFLELNPHIEAKDCEEDQFMAFRNNRLDWYKNDQERAKAITYDKLDSIEDADELVTQINRGLEVECITRITGYFSKVSGWNDGKKAELKDRRKFHVACDSNGNSACPVAHVQ